MPSNRKHVFGIGRCQSLLQQAVEASWASTRIVRQSMDMRNNGPGLNAITSSIRLVLPPMIWTVVFTLLSFTGDRSNTHWLLSRLAV